MIKKVAGVLIVSLMISAAGIGVLTEKVAAAEKSGEALFKQFCAACHPDGGNLISPLMTLKKSDMYANHVVNEDHIVKIMRDPGTGMTKFDEKTISNDDAKAIAKYIRSAFGK